MFSKGTCMFECAHMCMYSNTWVYLKKSKSKKGAVDRNRPEGQN